MPPTAGHGHPARHTAGLPWGRCFTDPDFFPEGRRNAHRSGQMLARSEAVTAGVIRVDDIMSTLVVLSSNEWSTSRVDPRVAELSPTRCPVFRRRKQRERMGGWIRQHFTTLTSGHAVCACIIRETPVFRAGGAQGAPRLPQGPCRSWLTRRPGCSGMRSRTPSSCRRLPAGRRRPAKSSFASGRLISFERQ